MSSYVLIAQNRFGEAFACTVLSLLKGFHVRVLEYNRHFHVKNMYDDDACEQAKDL